MKTKRRNYWSFFWRVGAGFLAFWLVVMAGVTLLLGWQTASSLMDSLQDCADDYLHLYIPNALSDEEQINGDGSPKTEAEMEKDLLGGAYIAEMRSNPEADILLTENAIIELSGELLQSNRYWLAGTDESSVWYVDMNDQPKEIYEALLESAFVDYSGKTGSEVPPEAYIEAWIDGNIAYPKTITMQPRVATGTEWVAQGEPTVYPCSYDESKMQGLPLKDMRVSSMNMPGSLYDSPQPTLDSMTSPRRAALRAWVESPESPAMTRAVYEPWLVQYFVRNIEYCAFAENDVVAVSFAGEAYPIKACLPTLVPVYGFSFALAVLFSAILAFALLRVWRKQERVEQARRDTTAALAHELKTPLSVLSATAELLSNDMAQDKRAHYLDVIRQQAARMDGSVGRMLELSRLEAGAKALRRVKFTLSDLAQERLDAAVPPDADLHTEVTVSGADAIEADRALLARALDAILENAVQHTAPGGSIAVRIENGVCAVGNTGAPIPPDALPRLWEAYYQADASRAAKGDGLGLSIAKTVFDLHGYAYGAENTDEGPRFWFRFG